MPARIVSWPSGISARTAQTPSRSLGAAPLPGLVARAPGEGEGGVEQQHREDEVAHHQARRQVVLDDQGAEDRLADHAQRQQRPEERQVPAERAAEPGEDAGGDHGEADEAGEQAVAVLDHRVGVERRHGAAVALGPVRAAEPGAGEAHGGAGQHDQRQRREGDEGDLGVELRRDVEAVFRRARIVPSMMPAARWAAPAQPPLLFFAPPPFDVLSIRYWTRSSSSFGVSVWAKLAGITLAG